MIVIVTFFHLLLITWLFCTATALYLSNQILAKPMAVVLLLWVMAILILLLVLVAAGFVGSTESDRKLYVYFTLPLMIFPPVISLLVAKGKSFARHVAVMLASFVLAVPVAATWVILFI